MRSVLVTGPIESAAEYCAAARAAGWQAIELPLLRIVPHRHEVGAFVGQRFDWICVTSSNALAFLGDLARASHTVRTTPCAVVGERSAERARAIGLNVAHVSASASALAVEIAERAGSAAHVLWPRGHLSDDLARALRERGITVLDAVVYATEPLAHRSLPRSEAVFFASPSAVHAWHAIARDDEDARTAIAIGAATFDALMAETGSVFFDTISLPEPTPEAFGFVLAHL